MIVITNNFVKLMLLKIENVATVIKIAPSVNVSSLNVNQILSWKFLL